MSAPLRHSAFVKHDRHGRSLPVLIALDQRNSLIIDLRRTFYPNVSGREAARLMYQGLARFEAGPWRRLQSEECPERYKGRIEHAYFVILRVAGRTPSEILIRKIISTTRYPACMLDCGPL